MGIVTSIFCTMTFCLERILTCTCCAFLLMLMLFGVLLMLTYGVSIGYHFSQKELASFAVQTRGEPTTDKADAKDTAVTPNRRSGDDEDSLVEAPYVRLVAVNNTRAGRRADEEEPHDVELVFGCTPNVILNKDAAAPPDKYMKMSEPDTKTKKDQNMLSRLLATIRKQG